MINAQRLAKLETGGSVAGPPASPEPALASQGSVGQILSCLLENSLNHGAGSTTVTARAAGTWAVLEVTDEGGGVPPELASRVFHGVPYRR